jgi:molybdenum cofactor biosynthesis enzyme
MATLIPLCHPVMLRKVNVIFEIDEANSRIVVTRLVATPKSMIQ